MILKIGQSLASTTDTTVVIVVRAPQGDVDLTCGGGFMREGRQGESVDGAVPSDDHSAGTELGKRYESPTGDLELMCVKPGPGSLAVAGARLDLKSAKALPSSD